MGFVEEMICCFTRGNASLAVTPNKTLNHMVVVMSKYTFVTGSFLLVCLVVTFRSHGSEIGKVVSAINELTIQRAGETLYPARRTPINERDVIQTGRDAKAQFRLIDGTLFSMGENSALSVDRYLFDETHSEAKFSLIKGVFRAITAKITQVENPKFNVETPIGSIGIRGTDFWGGYLDEGKVDVLLISGEHAVVVENQYGKTILSEPGEGTTIEPSQAPTKAKRWPQAKVNRALATIEN